MHISPCTEILAGTAGPKTVLVLGVYRGGTSFIAKTLAGMGVPMGHRNRYGVPQSELDPVDYCNYEDTLLWLAMQDGRWDVVEKIIAERNAVHDTWGFKWPGSVFRLNRMLPLIRQPHLIAIFRDPAAIFQGQVARGCTAVFSLIAAHLERLAAVADDPPAPLLAVSYERGQEAPELVAQAIGAFLGVAPPADLSTLELDTCAYLSPESPVTSAAASPAGFANITPEPRSSGSTI